MANMDETPAETYNDVTCSLCRDFYDDPRLLPCGDSFCRRCLQSLYQALGGRLLRCPDCRQTMRLGRRGLEGLPQNERLAALVDEVQEQDEPPEASVEYTPPNGMKSSIVKVCFTVLITSLVVACFVSSPSWFTWQTVQAAFEFVTSLYKRIFFSPMSNAISLLFMSFSSLSSAFGSFWSVLKAVVFLAWAIVYLVLAAAWFLMSIVTMVVLIIMAVVIYKGSLPDCLENLLIKVFCHWVLALEPLDMDFCGTLLTSLLEGELVVFLRMLKDKAVDGVAAVVVVTLIMTSIVAAIVMTAVVIVVAVVIIAMGL